MNNLKRAFLDGALVVLPIGAIVLLVLGIVHKLQEATDPLAGRLVHPVVVAVAAPVLPVICVVCLPPLAALAVATALPHPTAAAVVATAVPPLTVVAAVAMVAAMAAAVAATVTPLALVAPPPGGRSVVV